MKTLRRSGVLTPLVLLLLCAAAGGLVAWELSVEPLRSLPEEAVAPDAGAATGERSARPEFNPPPKSAFLEITERPIFLPTRRPLPPESSPAAPAVRTDLSRYLLVGIVISPTERVALLETQPGPEIVELKQGEKLKEWWVAEITPNGVVFRTGDIDYEMRLDESEDRARR